MKESFELSIVLVSSKKDMLLACLKDIGKELKGIKHEIIVVDNASQDKLNLTVKEKYPKVKVIRREENGGFGENNNLGLKVAKGKYVLLLNDDIEIFTKNIFKEMIMWMDKHPKVGVSSCALVNRDKKTYQGSGGYFPTLPRVFMWMTFLDDIPFMDKIIKPYHPLHPWSIFKNESYFKKPHQQDWVTGAFYLMRKKALDEVGFFDEDFFLYVEEVELSYRFKEKGWEVWYLPNWKIVHYGQITTGSENAMIFEMKNMVLFYKKHFPKFKIPILRFLLKMGCVLRIVLFGVLKGPQVSKTYVKAFKEI